MSLLDDWDAREEGGNASPSPPTSTNPFATSNPFAVEDPVPPPSTPSTTNPFGAPTEPKQEIYERAGSQSDLQHRASADSFLSLDGALGRSPREHDQGPSFFLRARLGPSTGPVSFEPGFNQPIRHVAAAQNLVLVCTDEQVYLWDVDKEPAPMADNCVVSNAVKSRNVFMDPSAQHLLLFLENGEAYYHSLVGLSKKLKSPVKAWRNLAVQSVAWISEETTEHTAHFLLGTRDGAIVEAMVEDQKVKEKSVKELFRLPDALPIFGLRLEAFPTASAMKKWFIMAVTAAPTRYYQFIGGPTVQDVFEAYKDALSEQTQFVELPSNLDYSELHMYTKYIGQRATTFTMLTGAGIFHGKLSYGSQSPGEDVVKVYDMLSFPEETLSGQRLSTGAPLSMEETELHYVLLYADCLVVVNKINEQVVFDKKLEDEARVVQDAAAGRVWVFSSSSIYEFVIENESKNAWRLYLDKAIREGSGRDFQLAVQQCSTEEQKQEVITVQADFYFQSGKFDLAARYYADSSKPFEEVALVLIQEKQQDALKTYLLLKLKQMPMTAKTQRTILAVWIVEIYLEKLSSFARAQVEPITSLEEPDNQEEDPARAETVRSKESTVGAARLSVFQEFCGFLSDHFKSLDPARDTVFDMISSHGLVEELLYYADLAEDYERVITYYLQQEQFSMAVDRLLEQVKSDRGKVAELFYKYSPALIAKCPAKLVDAWIEARMLDPCKLLPAMVRCTEPKEAARFLEHCVYSQGNRDQAIHNFLVSLYAEGEIGNQSLLEFLKFDGACFEKKYALRQCTKRKQVRGCVAIYLQMGMFDAAVESALTVDIELAKECASSEVEEELQKSLWIKIIKHSMGKDEGVGEALKLLKESEVLKIEDILPIIPHFTVIDDIKDEICHSLEEYNNAIEQLKVEMNDYTKTAENIRKEIEEQDKKFQIITATQTCNLCGLPVIGKQTFYVFPCSHAFHADCLLNEVSKHLREDQRAHVEVFRKAAQEGYRHAKSAEMSKAQHEAETMLHEFLSASCPFCGDIMVESVAEPLITAEDEAEALDWEL